MMASEMIESIETSAQLAEFIQKLGQEYRTEPESWENSDLGSFLEALSAWVQDMKGFYESRGMQVPEHPDWRDVAHMLAAARVYE